MADNFPAAYQDLVDNTTLLEKHMRDMQARCCYAGCAVDLLAGYQQCAPGCIWLHRNPSGPGLRQHAALSFELTCCFFCPPCRNGKRTANSLSKMASFSCCKPATASAPALQPSWCAYQAAQLLSSSRCCIRAPVPPPQNLLPGLASPSVHPPARPPSTLPAASLPPAGRGGNGARGPRQPRRVCADGGAPPPGSAAAPYV